MPGGGATISTNQKREPNGPPFPANSAFNGLSVDTTTGQIVLGNDFTDPAQLAKFVSFREVDMNGFNIFWDIWGNFGGGPSPEYFSYGQNPFVGINGATLGINYGAWPPAVNGLMGWYMNEYVVGSVGAFLRGVNNDSWMLGEFYNGFGSILAPVSRFNLFDSGNCTFVSTPGTYPQPADVDTGFGFAVLSAKGFLVSPDQTLAEQMFYLNRELVLKQLTADWSNTTTIGLQNNQSVFVMGGDVGNDISGALPGTDIAELRANFGAGAGNTSMLFSSAGNLIFTSQPDRATQADSGNFIQVYGNIETKPSLAPADGAIFNGSRQTNVAGSVSGNVLFSQPEQGASYKKVIIFLNNLTGTAAYVYPTPFLQTPVILTTSGLAAGVITTGPTITTLTVTGAGTTGILIVEGF